MDNTPFIFGKMATDLNFTARSEELFKLRTNFESLINTVILSPRRWGKSSLVNATANKLSTKKSKIKICQIDLFDVRTEEEFYTTLAIEVLKITSSKWEDMLKNAKTFLSQLLPRVTFSPSLESEISFGIAWEKLKKDANDILDLAENIAKAKNIKVVVCIDEFQNIVNFDEQLAIQKKLRARWQRHKHVAYCLYGSKRHMMLNIFTNPSMPFYKFGDVLLLQKITTPEWTSFICKRFKDTNKEIDRKDAEKIAMLVDNHSYYVQQLAQQVWLRTARKCKTAVVTEAHERLADQLSLQFINVTDTLTTTQVNFLRAVLNDKTHFNAVEVLNEFKLGTSANVNRIKQRLLDREIIDIVNNEVVFQDPLYKYWLQRDYFGIL